MPQLASGGRFETEPGDHLRQAWRIRNLAQLDDLDRDRSPRRDIAGPPDFAECAPAQRDLQLVPSGQYSRGRHATPPPVADREPGAAHARSAAVAHTTRASDVPADLRSARTT